MLGNNTVIIRYILWSNDRFGLIWVIKDNTYTIASFIFSTIYFTSSSVTNGPLGKHIPTLKRLSLTPLRMLDNPYNMAACALASKEDGSQYWLYQGRHA